MDLQALSDFNLVARHGSLAAASRASNRSKATLSRRVAKLEETMGLRLLERGAGPLRLTEEGRRLHERTDPLLAAVAEAGEDLTDRSSMPSGRLCVSAPVVLSHTLLGGLAARFTARYPAVELEIRVEDRVVDPVEEGIDVAIRIDPTSTLDLVGRRICRTRHLLVAPPDLELPPAREDGAPAPVPGVARIADKPPSLWTVETSTGTRHLAPRVALSSTSLMLLRDAALEGAGFALLPELLVARDLREARLIAHGRSADAGPEIWALHTSRRLPSARIRAFLDTLITELPEQLTQYGAPPDS